MRYFKKEHETREEREPREHRERGEREQKREYTYVKKEQGAAKQPAAKKAVVTETEAQPYVGGDAKAEPAPKAEAAPKADEGAQCAQQ